MSAQTLPLGATSMAPIWWIDDFASGLICYIGASRGGIEFSRHGWSCAPGKWQVGMTGWGMHSQAVMDDFGDLIEVRQ